jgi:outer membrane protein
MPYPKPPALTLGLIGAWLFAGCALAQAPAKPDSPWRLGVALGYGERSNPLIQSRDIPVAVDLDIAWFGKRFFFDNGDLGLTFMNRPAGTASFVVRANSDRVFFSRTSTRFVSVSVTGAPLSAPAPLKPPKRRYAIETGVEYLLDGRWGRMSLAGFQDVSSVHNGFGADLEYGYAIQGRRWTLEPSILLRYKSGELNDYYWGVRAGEASAALPAYDAGEGLNWQLGVRSSYYFSRRLRFVATFNYERLNADAAHSPLVEQRAVRAYFGGFAYSF